MPVRGRSLALPELFLGLLSIGVAVVLTAKIVAGTIHDARHTRDTISVTGSARKPISSDLVRWSLTVSREAPTAATAAKHLQGDVAKVRTFLQRAGIPSNAISLEVVESQQQVVPLGHHRRKISYRVSQGLIAQGIDVSAGSPAYISTELTQAKLDALAAATADARTRAEILVHGLGGKLGPMRRTQLGVYQITPRDSTEISDYGINDTTSREKDVNAVVTATFAVNR